MEAEGEGAGGEGEDREEEEVWLFLFWPRLERFLSDLDSFFRDCNLFSQGWGADIYVDFDVFSDEKAFAFFEESGCSYQNVLDCEVDQFSSSSDPIMIISFGFISFCLPFARVFKNPLISSNWACNASIVIYNLKIKKDDFTLD